MGQTMHVRGMNLMQSTLAAVYSRPASPLTIRAAYRARLSRYRGFRALGYGRKTAFRLSARNP